MLTAEHFPSAAGTVSAKWAPVLLRPVMGSPEQLVVAVVAAGDHGFHIERANAPKRLECLYGTAAETLVFAAEAALDELEAELAAEGLGALRPGELLFSSLHLGPMAVGEAGSLEELAQAWMGAMSSLYVPSDERHGAVLDLEDEVTGRSDRLPQLVLHHIEQAEPKLARYFSEEIKQHRVRRSRAKVAGVNVDFAGTHLVANFATLEPRRQAFLIDHVKRQVLDLLLTRDTDPPLLPRQHQLIVHTPDRDDPSLSERQLDQLEEAVVELAKQAEHEELGFLPMHGVPQIGQHIVAAELGEAVAA